MCNVVGGALKAVDVKTENATGDFARLKAFCIKDRGDQKHYPRFQGLETGRLKFLNGSSKSKKAKLK